MEISTIGFVLLISGVVIVLIFCFAFFLELIFKKDGKLKADIITEEPKNDDELDLDAMLSKLEEKSKIIEQPKIEPIKAEEEELDFDAMFAKLEETVKKSNMQKEEEKPQIVAVVESEIQEEVKEEVKEDIKEEAQPKIDVSVGEEKTKIEPTKTEVVINVIKDESNIDYLSRLETLKENYAKLEKDLVKSTKELNKFERTAKRKARNEKLLDKKAGELANLNLIMYNVNDIKDVDPEKKIKQEELTEHIIELKDSIKTANEYLQNNKEKNANAKKLNNFLTKEKARYIEEIKELEEFILNSKPKS